MTNIKKAMFAFSLSAAMICGGSAIAKPKANKQKGAKCTTECTQTPCPSGQGNCQPTPSCRPDTCNEKGKCGVHRHGDRKRHHGKHQNGYMARAMQNLNLTEAQRDSIKLLRISQCKASKEAERRLKMQRKENFDNGLKAILTPEQYAQYQANLEQMKQACCHKHPAICPAAQNTPKEDNK